MKYHLNPETGEPGQCNATLRCPFGGDEVHYPTPEDARIAYEHSMAGQAFRQASDPGQAMLPIKLAPAFVPPPRQQEFLHKTGFVSLFEHLRNHEKVGSRPTSETFELIYNEEEGPVRYSLNVVQDGESWSGTVESEHQRPSNPGVVEVTSIPVGPGEGSDNFVSFLFEKGYLHQIDALEAASGKLKPKLRLAVAAERTKRDLTRLTYEDPGFTMPPIDSLKRSERKERSAEQAWLSARLKTVDWTSRESLWALESDLRTRSEDLSEAGSMEKDRWATRYHTIGLDLKIDAGL